MTVSKVRRKKRKLRREIKYGLWAGGIILFILFVLLVILPLIDRFRLSSLGYTRTSVEAIVEQKLSKEILKREYSNALDINLSKGHKVKDHLELYYVNTEVDEKLIQLNDKLLEKGYAESDLLLGFGSLKYREMCPLLVLNNVTDMNAYIQDVLINRNVENSFISDKFSIYYDRSIEVEDPSDLTVLVNKYHHIPKDYVPELVQVSVQYASSGVTLRADAYEAFRSMVKAMKNDGLVGIYISSGYRSYEKQEGIYNRNVASKGQDWTDRYSARPGSSEHQLGLAVDVTATANPSADFSTSKEYEWLLDHAHEYGYILRYTQENDSVTGYDYEPWHYRYLGVELATKVYESQLTYDEYYELYLR